MGQENSRFAQALRDESLRTQLMVEYARRSILCGWAAVLQAGIALVLFLFPGTQMACYVFLCIGFAFVVLSLRMQRDLRLLKRADQRTVDEPPAG